MSQQSRLTTLSCPGWLTKNLILNKFPFQLNELSMVGQYNEDILKDLPESIISFIKTQKQLQTLEISVPGNLMHAHVKELFGLLNQVKSLDLYCDSNLQDLSSFFKGCTSNELEILKLKFNKVTLDSEHFKLVTKQFPKLKHFECGDDRGFLYIKDFSIIKDNQNKDIETFWFQLPTNLAIENIHLKLLESSKVAINICNEIPAAFKTFILHNSNITNFEIQYINAEASIMGLEYKTYIMSDHVIVEMIDFVLNVLKKLKTITVFSMFPVQNKEFFDKSIEKCKRQKNLEKISFFENLMNKPSLKHVSYSCFSCFQAFLCFATYFLKVSLALLFAIIFTQLYRTFWRIFSSLYFLAPHN